MAKTSKKVEVKHESASETVTVATTESKSSSTPHATSISCKNCEGGALITTNVARGIQVVCPHCSGTGLEPVNG